MSHSLILNIPHASTFIPAEDRDKVFLPFTDAFCKSDNRDKKTRTHSEKERDEAIKNELLVMTDWYTDELFDHSIGSAIVANVSRLVCDTERFSHDENEEMASRGMGFCYENGSKNQVIKTVTPEYKDEILWRYYAPHHIALTDAVENSLKVNDKALILDCHSFSADPLPYETDQCGNRPDICIGTDSYHTPEQLLRAVERFFNVRNFSTAINAPYGGTMVPLRHYKKDSRVMSIMIEVNRGLYLKNESSSKNRHFEQILKTLFDLEVMLSLMQF